MKLQLQKYVYERVDETTATNVCLGCGWWNYSYKCFYMIGFMKLQLEMIV